MSTSSQPERKIRVLIVEDSPTMRLLLEGIIAADPRLEVAASVETAEEALRILAKVAPDIISLDIRLPGMNGFQATRRIMAERPTPIVVVSASVEADDLNISMNALDAGALSVVEKPGGTSSAEHAALAHRLCRQLVIMSEVPVIRQRGRQARVDRLAAGSVPRQPAMAPRPRNTAYEVLGMVASTGGPNAVLSVLRELGADYPLPILLVQHMTASFLPGFVAWLDASSPLKVVMARDGDLARPGHVYLPVAERHLEFDGTRLRVVDGLPVSNQKPSGTVLLQSLARSLGPRALAVLLTGMGDDGADGLLAVRAAGGYTVAEDESTAVVYGMPAVAARIGAVEEILPLHRIGSRLREISMPQRNPADGS